MVIIGAMTRPEFADLRLDWGAVKRAAGIAAAVPRRRQRSARRASPRSSSARAFGSSARMRSRPRLLAPIGPVRRARGLRAKTRRTSRLAARLLAALSAFDVGQGAIVAAGRVLAIEAAEGTDAMLARVAEMRASGRLRLAGPGGRPREGAEAGPGPAARHAARSGRRRSRRAIKAQLRGVAIAAGRVLVLERERCAREADAAGLFVVGLAPSEARPDEPVARGAGRRRAFGRPARLQADAGAARGGAGGDVVFSGVGGEAMEAEGLRACSRSATSPSWASCRCWPGCRRSSRASARPRRRSIAGAARRARHHRQPRLHPPRRAPRARGAAGTCRSSTMSAPASGPGGPGGPRRCALMSIACWRLLPFEPEAYRRLGGPRCVYVGHPLIERLDELRPSGRGAPSRIWRRRSSSCCPARAVRRSRG